MREKNTQVERALGLGPSGGLLRVGFLHYHTADEVDRLVDALKRAVRAQTQSGGLHK